MILCKTGGSLSFPLSSSPLDAEIAILQSLGRHSERVAVRSRMNFEEQYAIDMVNVRRRVNEICAHIGEQMIGGQW